MAAIIPSGTTQAESADFTLASGETTTIGIFNAEAVSLPDMCLAQVQRKGSNGVYTALGQGLGNLDWQVRERGSLGREPSACRSSPLRLHSALTGTES